MAKLPRGTTVSITTVQGAEKTITAASNAVECVLTIEDNDFIVGDYLEVTNSGWGKLSKRGFLVKAVAANNVTLQGCNTTATDLYPAGAGVGTCRKQGAPVQITQVTDLTSSGGEPQQVEYFYLEDENNYTINNGFSAVSYTLTIDADAIGTAGWNALETNTETQKDIMFVIRKKDGGRTILPATVALSTTESYTDGQIITTTAAINGRARPTRYKGS